MVNRFRQFSTIDVFLCFTDARKGKLRFSWKGDGKPEQVDWEGQRNQFDCAKEEGLQQVAPWKHSLNRIAAARANLQSSGVEYRVYRLLRSLGSRHK